MKEIFKTKNKINVKLIVEILIFFFLMFICNHIKVGNYVLPFSFAIYFSLIWCDENVWVLSGLFLLSNILTFFSLPYFCICLIGVVLFIYIKNLKNL